MLPYIYDKPCSIYGANILFKRQINFYNYSVFSSLTQDQNAFLQAHIHYGDQQQK